MSPVFNETVNIVEPDEGLIDGETYVFSSFLGRPFRIEQKEKIESK